MMEEKIKNLLSEFLSKTLGKKADEITPLLTEEKIGDALNTILSWDEVRVNAFKKKEADAFEKGYKKANGEVKTNFENKYKEKFPFDSNKTGIELIEEYVASQASSKEITEEQVKSHPAYTNLEKSIKLNEKRLTEEWEAKYNGLISEQKRKEVLSIVMKEARAHLEGLNPVLPDDKSIRENQLKWFDKELNDMQYEIRENADKTTSIFILDKDGKRLENQHGHPKDFKEFISDIASRYWPFSKTQKRTAAAPEGSQGASGGGEPKTWQSKIQLRKPVNDADAQKVLDEINKHPELTKSEKLDAQIALADMMNGVSS